jgi:hypothetical protein
MGAGQKRAKISLRRIKMRSVPFEPNHDRWEIRNSPENVTGPSFLRVFDI